MEQHIILSHLYFKYILFKIRKKYVTFPELSRKIDLLSAVFSLLSFCKAVLGNMCIFRFLFTDEKKKVRLA